jgi:hypothetical protein
LEYPEKIRNEEMMKKLSLHFAIIIIIIIIRQRIRNKNKFNKKLEICNIREKYLKKNIKYRELEKFLNWEKINSQEKSTVYRIP